jgi:hypothetical membrane protein
MVRGVIQGRWLVISEGGKEMMTKYASIVILLTIGLSRSYLIKGGLYLAGIEPSATLAYWILGSVCFASILYLLYAIKRLGRGRSDVSLVAEPCIGFLVLLVCCNAWGLAFSETIPAANIALPVFWVLSAAGMFLAFCLVRAARKNDSSSGDTESA